MQFNDMSVDDIMAKLKVNLERNVSNDPLVEGNFHFTEPLVHERLTYLTLLSPFSRVFAALDRGHGGREQRG